MESPFDILRIDSGADDDEVDRAYRQRVMETHPDQGGSSREFQLVQEAYEEIVSDGRGGVFGDEREAGTDQDRMQSRVEYLNYERIADFGWSLDDADLFEKASDEELDPADYGRFLVQPHETLLEAAENRGFAWPYACRGGACANCAVAVTAGELSMPVNHILPPEMMERDIQLSCVGAPLTDELQVVFNVKHLPDLDELRLPPRPFEQAQLDD